MVVLLLGLWLLLGCDNTFIRLFISGYDGQKECANDKEIFMALASNTNYKVSKDMDALNHFLSKLAVSRAPSDLFTNTTTRDLSSNNYSLEVFA